MSAIESGTKAVEDRLIGLFPDFSDKERRISVALLRELAKGSPVGAATLAEASGAAAQDVQAFLDGSSLIFKDDEGRVIGFSGLAISETQHRFCIGGKKLHTWCAWDALFLPSVLGSTAEMQTQCPITGESIRVTISPTGIESLEPAGAVMSLLNPEPGKIEANVVKHFCHYVYFFKDRSSGEEWTAKNPGTFLVNLADGFRLGKSLVAAKFGI